MLGCAPADVDRCWLGDVRERRYRRALRAALEAALRADDAMRVLADVRLADLLPGSTLLLDGPIGEHQGSARLNSALARNGVRCWSELLELRLGAMPGLHAAVAELVGLAFERSLTGLASSEAEAEPAGVDLAILLGYEGDHALLDALTRLAGEGHPDTVRSSAQRLLRTMPATARHDETLRDVLSAAGSPRDADVFAQLCLDRRHRIEDVARRLRMSAEGVRQVRRRTEHRVRCAAAAAPQPFGVMVRSVGRWLGSVVPQDVAEDLARRIGGGSSRDRTAGLLLWLAGPYVPVPGHAGWLALDPSDIVAVVADSMAADAGVCALEDVAGELAAAGVRAEHRARWLEACGVIIVDGMAVSISCSPAAVCERVLFAAGHGMEPEDIARLLPAGPTTAAIRNALQRDRRFVRVAADVFELAEWGSAPFAAPAQDTQPHGEPCWVRVLVDEEVLRGGTRPVPIEVVGAMGVSRGHRATYATRFGPVHLTHEGAEPMIGSLRPVALACGARPGDHLWLGFGPDRDVVVRLDDQTDESRHLSLAGAMQGDP